MTQHQEVYIQRRLRALRAVLTGAACAVYLCLLMSFCVMLVVLIAHVVFHAVSTQFS